MNRYAFPLSCFGLTDIGHVRTNNEDVFLNLKEHGFFALADGMGGHNAGEVAASEAVRFVSTSIEEFFASENNELSIFDLSSFNKLCIENANSYVHHLGKKKKDYKGMGTTLCTLLFHQRSLIYSHVGDSRIYRFREGTLDQLTLDHSLTNRLIENGQISKQKSHNLPYKNILTRAIGTHVDVEAEIHIAPVIPNDIYLMCSDGLTDQITDEEISAILKNAKDIKGATTKLVERAKEEGGRDNVTVVIVKTQHENLSR